MRKNNIWYPIQTLPRPTKTGKQDKRLGNWRPIQTIGPKNDK